MLVILNIGLIILAVMAEVTDQATTNTNKQYLIFGFGRFDFKFIITPIFIGCFSCQNTRRLSR